MKLGWILVGLNLMFALIPPYDTLNVANAIVAGVLAGVLLLERVTR